MRKKKYRVYNLTKVPFKGGKDFYDVETEKEAISLTKKKNKKSRKIWVWSDL